MALYIFQFGLLQPIASIVNSQVPIIVFTLILLFIMMLKNHFRIKKYVVIIFIISSVCFLFNVIVYPNNSIVSINTFIEFIFKGFSAFIVGSLDADGEELYNAFLKLATLNFILIAMFPFGFLDSMNYMRFGYAMIPSAIMFWFEYVSKRKYKFFWLFISILASALTIIYGARGVVVCFMVLGLLIFIFNEKITITKKSISLVMGTIIFFILSKYNLILKLLDYIYFNIGIKTYSLMKFRRMFTGAFLEASSGRDRIYKLALSYIKQNPLIGFGIGYMESISGYKEHNLFLQILLESGVFGLLIWICIWIYCLIAYVKISRLDNKAYFKITTLIISISVGRLLVSSDLWVRPEYWFVLSMFINFQVKQKYFKKFISF